MTDGGTRRALRVLHVEDDRLVATVFAALFDRQTAFDLRLADSVAEAQATVADWTPDVFIIDSRLPGGDGAALLAWLRADDRFRSTPAYMCSGDDRPGAIADALAAGFTGYWTKPMRDLRIPTELMTLAAAMPPVR